MLRPRDDDDGNQRETPNDHLRGPRLSIELLPPSVAVLFVATPSRTSSPGRSVGNVGFFHLRGGTLNLVLISHKVSFVLKGNLAVTMVAMRVVPRGDKDDNGSAAAERIFAGLLY
jgi:hypothetical protein